MAMTFILEGFALCKNFMMAVKMESQVFHIILYWLNITPQFCNAHAYMPFASVRFQYLFKNCLHTCEFCCIWSAGLEKNKNKLHIKFIC